MQTKSMDRLNENDTQLTNGMRDGNSFECWRTSDEMAVCALLDKSSMFQFLLVQLLQYIFGSQQFTLPNNFSIQNMDLWLATFGKNEVLLVALSTRMPTGVVYCLFSWTDTSEIVFFKERQLLKRLDTKANCF